MRNLYLLFRYGQDGGILQAGAARWASPYFGLFALVILPWALVGPLVLALRAVPGTEFALFTLLATPLTIFLLGSFAPDLHFGIMDNPRRELLDTFPIRRWERLAFHAFSALNNSVMSVSLLVALFLAFGWVSGSGWAVLVCGTISALLLTMAAGICVCALLSRLGRVFPLRAVAWIFQLLELMAFLGLSQGLRPDGTKAASAFLLQERMTELATHGQTLARVWNPVTWLGHALTDARWAVAVAALGIGLFAGASRFFHWEGVDSAKKNAPATPQRLSASRGISWMGLDALQFLRNPQLAYAIAMPYILAIFFWIVGKADIPMLMIAMLAPTLAGQGFAALVATEVRTFPHFLLLPANHRDVLLAKRHLPFLLHTGASVAFVLTMFAAGAPARVLLTIPPIVALILCGLTHRSWLLFRRARLLADGPEFPQKPFSVLAEITSQFAAAPFAFIATLPAMDLTAGLLPSLATFAGGVTSACTTVVILFAAIEFERRARSALRRRMRECLI